ncbi:MAG: peptidoglycan bridge formation glycyltransferase FemA/FemB family protein [Deltaproteobacteria bacterium]
MALDEDDKVLGILPSFLKDNGNFGAVLNSLPFYGSNGGVIEYEGNELVKEQLINAFYALAEGKNCVSATIITSPFEENINFYDEKVCFTFKDNRVGQLTKLPTYTEEIENDLFNIYHYKTRNTIRKAKKEKVRVSSDYSDDILRFLMSVHSNNMLKIGGIEKPKNFFELISQVFYGEKDFKIYTAYLENKPIAALLVFYFNKTVEYYTPVIEEDYRNKQGLSLCIFEAMKDAIGRGYEWWNWGGTWTSQNGVYDFKKRWGTQDREYFYYTRIFNDKIMNLSKETLLKEYPFFYVLPFGRLSK